MFKANSLIYLDNHATTPVDPRVLKAMLPFLEEHFGNAASKSHVFGWQAEAAVESARESLAALIGAPPGSKIIFTSGATEANNLALLGLLTNPGGKKQIITQVTEHVSILDPCKILERAGFQVSYLPVDRYGQISLEQLAQALTPETLLVSIMYANNEIGTLQDLQAIGRLCRERGVWLHTDAAQALGKVPLAVESWGIDLASFSAHKLYGPKGVGALYVRGSKIPLESRIFGGGQEFGLRSGTLNVPGIVGFGKAAALAAEELGKEGGGENAQIRSLRDFLESTILKELAEVYLNGHQTERLPGSLNLSFAGVDGPTLLLALTKHLAISSGSACNSTTLKPSHVLLALGLTKKLASNALRFGLGRFNTLEEISYTGELVRETVKSLRKLNS